MIHALNIAHLANYAIAVLPGAKIDALKSLHPAIRRLRSSRSWSRSATTRPAMPSVS